MAQTATEQPKDATPAPALPDYVLSPNAVFNDEGVEWRYGRAPDYSKTRKFWEEGRKSNHAADSLERIVENLVKNWEVEASFKPRLSDWRTIDPEKYTFAMSGGEGQPAEHMLKVGTYNAIIAPNEYYDPSKSDFASSHKTFKRMMPTFAWEVMEVYTGPPTVIFRWRHWGQMKNDYVGFNNKGEKVTAKAHGGPIEIFGVTIAKVDDKLRVQSLDTYMDSLAMFKLIAPNGIVNKEIVNHEGTPEERLDAVPAHDGIQIAKEYNDSHTNDSAAPTREELGLTKHISNITGQPADAPLQQVGGCPFMGQNSSNGSSQIPKGHPSVTNGGSSNGTSNGDLTNQATVNGRRDINTAVAGAPQSHDGTSGSEKDEVKRSIYSSAITGNVENVIKAPRTGKYRDESITTGTYDAVDQHLEKSSSVVHPHPKTVEEQVKPGVGDAVAAPARSEETRKTVEEMSKIRPDENELIMNRE